MAKVQEIGPYSAYAIAVKYGYQGNEEEWVKEQEENREASEAAAAAAAQSAKDAAASASGAAQSGQQAVQSIKDAQTAAEQAIDTAKQQAVQAAQAEAEKAANSAGQAASSAAEAAQSATNAAAEVGKVQSAGTAAVQAVQQAQTEAVSAVQAEGTSQTSAVSTAASSALTNISGAKDAALSDVAEAGAAQVSAIGTTGADAVEDVNNAKTAALEAIDAANAALPAPTVSDAGKVPAVNAEGTGYELSGPYAPLSAAIRPIASGNPVNITDSVEWPLQGLKVYGKSVQAGTPSPEDPVPIVSAGEGGSVDLNITGANKIPYPYTDGMSKTANGIQFTVFDNGKISAQGTASGNASFSIMGAYQSYVEIYSGFLSGCPKISGAELRYISQELKNATDSGSGVNLALNPSFSGIGYIECRILDGNTVDCVFEPMLNPGNVMSPWEPYKSQSHPLSTPSGLPGIPVDSGGNYTDAEGQQSACDVKDYGTGKYTQMVGHIESYNSENITTPYMSTTGQLSTGAEVYYVLDEPVVTDISDDELAAYRALHTYDGSTVISTPEDVAGIEVRYVADGEKYIDRKISEAIASAAETKLAAYDTLSGAIHEGVNEA